MKQIDCIVGTRELSCLRNVLPISHLTATMLPMDTHTDSDILIAAVANMLKARFSLKQIAASLGISIDEAMRLIGRAGQDKL